MRLCVISLRKEDRHREQVEVSVFHSLESKHFSKRNLFSICWVHVSSGLLWGGSSSIPHSFFLLEAF